MAYTDIYLGFYSIRVFASIVCSLAAHFANSPFGSTISLPHSLVLTFLPCPVHTKTTKEFNYHFICVYLLGNENKESECDYNLTMCKIEQSNIRTLLQETNKNLIVFLLRYGRL